MNDNSDDKITRIKKLNDLNERIQKWVDSERKFSIHMNYRESIPRNDKAMKVMDSNERILRGFFKESYELGLIRFNNYNYAIDKSIALLHTQYLSGIDIRNFFYKNYSDLQLSVLLKLLSMDCDISFINKPRKYKFRQMAEMAQDILMGDDPSKMYNGEPWKYDGRQMGEIKRGIDCGIAPEKIMKPSIPANKIGKYVDRHADPDYLAEYDLKYFRMVDPRPGDYPRHNY